MTSEALTGQDVARTLLDVLDIDIKVEVLAKEDRLKPVDGKAVWNENAYAVGVREFAKQIRTGQLATSVRDDVAFVTGKPPMTLRQWSEKYRQRLLDHTNA
ncbi:hypothetical protein RvY_03901 [Ramazzottius varieornatus]|uniref:NmrA-like domain-containing protein n=1 Tax=Ramazzottius varieornatus TaxID=947166 RepID=A0A1D1UVC2_RAMVA|nr:hypothetical protein RvY_03901 [Ramazzottius varieornatus]